MHIFWIFLNRKINFKMLSMMIRKQQKRERHGEYRFASKTVNSVLIRYVQLHNRILDDMKRVSPPCRADKLIGCCTPRAFSNAVYWRRLFLRVRDNVAHRTRNHRQPAFPECSELCPGGLRVLLAVCRRHSAPQEPLEVQCNLLNGLWFG